MGWVKGVLVHHRGRKGGFPICIRGELHPSPDLKCGWGEGQMLHDGKVFNVGKREGGD